MDGPRPGEGAEICGSEDPYGRNSEVLGRGDNQARRRHCKISIVFCSNQFVGNCESDLYPEIRYCDSAGTPHVPGAGTELPGGLYIVGPIRRPTRLGWRLVIFLNRNAIANGVGKLK